MMAAPVLVHAPQTHVFVRELDRAYPLIERAEGVWLYDREGTAYLDGVGGGAMVCSLGHGVPEIIEAATRQAEKVSFLYNQQFTTDSQEELAAELCALAPPGFDRVHFVSGGAEAVETALRLARQYHVERGDTQRWRIISPAQAYHGPTWATLALTGRPGLQWPHEPYISQQPHIPPSTWRFDATGEAALRALDKAIADAGPETISAFLLEPVSAAALPAYTPPERFWHGLEERRRAHGFLVIFDEVVTGVGRTGAWFAAHRTPIKPDVIATAKGLGAGYAPIGGVLCTGAVYEAFERGSRAFELGHTWDGAPLPSAVGLAVLRYLKKHRLVERVAERARASARSSKPPSRTRRWSARCADRASCSASTTSTRATASPSCRPNWASPAASTRTPSNAASSCTRHSRRGDGFSGDQTLMAPAFTSTDEELDLMVERMAASVHAIESQIATEL